MVGTIFNPVKLGGGGFSVDIRISADESVWINRTDVHGAYIRNSPTEAWRPLFTATSMPAGTIDSQLGNNDANCYAVEFAPSLPSRIYTAYPGGLSFLSSIYRSDDTGGTFTKLTGLSPLSMRSNENPGRLFGPKMAVDPKNPDHVIVGDSNGLFWRTTNGGTTWAQITGIPTTSLTYPVVAFDPNSALTGSLTSTVYVAWGSGTNRVYRSTDGAATFSQLTGGPNTVRRINVAGNGTVYLCDNDGTAATNAWKLVGTTWTNLTASGPSAGNNWAAVAVDPTNNLRVVLLAGSGNLNYSGDGGSSWSGIFAGPSGAAAIRSSPAIPWMAATNENSMSTADVTFDQHGQVFSAEGIGLWKTTPPTTNATNPTWVSDSVGIETFIATCVIFPPGKSLLVACEDRAIFKISDPTAFPAAHGPFMDQPIRHGWSADYATSDSNFIAVLANGGAADRSAYSTDAGSTWTEFASKPIDFGLGGCVAVSTPANIIWAPSQDHVPSYTTDGGATWTGCVFPGAPTTPPTGWGFSQYQLRQVVCADRVTTGTFYAFNYDNTNGGLFKSTNGGATFTKFTGTALVTIGGMGSGARLLAVPGNTGHLLFAIGYTSPSDPHPYNSPLKRWTDSSAAWRDVTNTQEVWTVGFGKAAPAGTYPAVYIVGYANGDSTPGIYRSDDFTTDPTVMPTWTRLTSNPYGSTDEINSITGDMNVYGTVYFANFGSGAGYGRLAGTVAPLRMRLHA